MQFFLICTSVLNNFIFLFFLNGLLNPRSIWLPAAGMLLPPAVFSVAGLCPDWLLLRPWDLTALAFVWLFNILTVFIGYTDSLRKKRKAAFCALSLYLACSLLFVLFFCRKPSFYTGLEHESLLYRFVRMIFFFLCALVVCAAFILYKIRTKQMSLPNAALFCLFAATQILLMLSLLVRVYRNISDVFVWFCLASGLLCIIADFYVFKAFKEIRLKSRLRQQAYFYQKQLDIQLKHYEKLSQYDRTLSHIRHDLKNEISVIQVLLRQRNRKEAKELTDGIQKLILRLEKIERCENKILNALIFIESQKMEEQGIEFSCRDFEIPEEISADIPKLCETFSRTLEECIQKEPASIELSGRFSDGTFFLTSRFSASDSKPVRTAIYVS